MAGPLIAAATAPTPESASSTTSAAPIASLTPKRRSQRTAGASIRVSTIAMTTGSSSVRACWISSSSAMASSARSVQSKRGRQRSMRAAASSTGVAASASCSSTGDTARSTAMVRSGAAFGTGAKGEALFYGFDDRMHGVASVKGQYPYRHSPCLYGA